MNTATHDLIEWLSAHGADVNESSDLAEDDAGAVRVRGWFHGRDSRGRAALSDWRVRNAWCNACEAARDDGVYRDSWVDGDDFVLVVAPPASAPDDRDAIISSLRAEIRDLKAALAGAVSSRYRTGDPLRLKGWDNR